MDLSYSVLGSGSSGNAAVAELDGALLLIDVGLGPRTLRERLAAAGLEARRVAGAVISHTHGDHARDPSLGWMARERVPLYCHERHRERLASKPGFQKLRNARLVRTFRDRPFLAAPGIWVEPFELSHDGATFGFRLQGRSRRRGRAASIGHLTDTGDWCESVADALTDVDLLGIEFNHDEELQRRSSRSPELISRNLGAFGHLSNARAAALLRAILRRSGPGTLRQLVLLHLSVECNRPNLALAAARRALREADRKATVIAAHPVVPLADLIVRPAPRPRRAVSNARRSRTIFPPVPRTTITCGGLFSE